MTSQPVSKLTAEEISLLQRGYALPGLWFLDAEKAQEVFAIWEEREARINRACGFEVHN